MKIEFEDKSYLEISKSNKPNHCFVTIAAKSIKDSNSLIINSVDIDIDKLNELVKGLSK